MELWSRRNPSSPWHPLLSLCPSIKGIQVLSSSPAQALSLTSLSHSPHRLRRALAEARRDLVETRRVSSASPEPLSSVSADPLSSVPAEPLSFAPRPSPCHSCHRLLVVHCKVEDNLKIVFVNFQKHVLS
jgi:hypothetical protein